MLPFKKCPICGGEVVEKDVEKLLRGGNDTAVVRVNSEVCLHCGERLFSKETITFFEHIKSKLEKHDVSDFQLLGNNYKIAG